MSSRIFQSVILQMKDAVNRNIGVIDSEGNIVASTDLSQMGAVIKNVDFHNADEDGEVFVKNGVSYRCICDGNTPGDYCAFVQGEDELAKGICSVVAVALQETKNGYDDRHDTTSFIKNIISDNILPGDVYSRAKELRFNTEAPRAVYIIRMEPGTDVPVVEYLQKKYGRPDADYILSTSETDIVFIREQEAGCEEEDIVRFAKEVSDVLVNDLHVTAVVGIGSCALHLRELAVRYKEAQTAIEIGKVFNPNQPVVSYFNLGIGRIIYQLPNTLCEMFLAEVFKKNPIESLDEEILFTINKFFENNLNVSETSRNLFVHRNTLVYRLEKIKRLTGLDLREFDHAIVFKVALMVKKYLDSQNRHY